MEFEVDDIFVGFAKIESSEGWRLQGKINTLQLSFTIFYTNYKELNSLLDHYSKNTDLATHLMISENRDSFEAFLGEITRLLHNFLSSVKTLVDHTRAFCQDEYTGTEFYVAYQKRVSEKFVDVPLVKFIQDLRNFTLHKTLPIAGAKILFKKDSDTVQSITLDIDGLKDWGGWTSKAKEYMKSVGEDVNVQEVIDEYAEITTEFYNWFGDCQRGLHQKAMDELKELQVKQKEFMIKKGYSEDMLS